MAEVAVVAAMVGIEGAEAVTDEEGGMVVAMVEAAGTVVMIGIEALIETEDQCRSKKDKKSKLLSNPSDEEETESPASTTSSSLFQEPTREKKSRSE